jgi:cyclic 2,3-diphosphoglycerate synthetase
VTRALVLIDGEHYAPVVRDALAELPYSVAAAVVVGGTEKLLGGEDYGVPVAPDLESALAEHEVDLVFDLSDEPVLGPRERMRLASQVLAAGLPYAGADFRFDPPQLEPFRLPSLGIVGTGKRIGKTAVAGHVARLLSRDREVVVVAMGRGGPAQPEVASVPPTLGALLELSRAGRHAASDYLEDAALARVVTVGCRRCGGGLAGSVVSSNVVEGGEIAAALEPDLVIFEGSGAAFPPVATDRRLLVVGSWQEPALVTGFLNAFRILVSDLVVLTGAEDGGAHEELRAAIRGVKDVPVVATVLRPRPVEPVAGRRAALFTTAPERVHERLARHLAAEHGVEVTSVSGALANRPRLREDVARADADLFLVEIKAAAIDVVAEEAARRGIEIVFVDNEVLPLAGELDLDDLVRGLVPVPA